MNAIQAYWENLQARERRVLLGGAAALVLMLLYALVWDPYQRELARLEGSISEQRELLQWMQGTAEAIHRLRGSSPAVSTANGASLMTVVDSGARAQGLAEALQRVQPDGSNGVRVWLEQAEFDRLLGWIDLLERQQGIAVNSLVIEPQGPGRVKARLALERP